LNIYTISLFCHQGLKLLYWEVKKLTLPRIPRPILPTKHRKRSKGCFVGKISWGNLWLSKNFNFPTKYRVAQKKQDDLLALLIVKMDRQCAPA